MIELRQFSAGYPGRDWTVRNVDLTIQPGETVGLIGPNGSGKTTLIRGICSRIPSSGICRLAGETPGSAKALAQTFGKAFFTDGTVDEIGHYQKESATHQ